MTGNGKWTFYKIKRYQQWLVKGEHTQPKTDFSP